MTAVQEEQDKEELCTTEASKLQRIEAAVNAFRSTLVDIMAEGLTAEEAVVAADRAFINALQVNQEQQQGEQEAAVANALARLKAPAPRRS